MEWYKRGTASVTNGSAQVICDKAAFVENIERGEAFVGPDGKHYEIKQIVSGTELLLASEYEGETMPAGRYAIVPIQGYPRELAHKAAKIIESNQSLERSTQKALDDVGHSLDLSYSNIAAVEHGVESARQASADAKQSANNALAAEGRADLAAGEAQAAKFESAKNVATAKDWATKTGSEVVTGQGYSARHHAAAAAGSESKAAASAAAAKASETASSGSSVASSNSATAAQAGATAAQASASAAQASATAAKTSETATKSSQTAAAGSASTASTRAAEALTSAAAAKASETNAKTSELAAAGSAAKAASDVATIGSSLTDAAAHASAASASAAAAKTSQSAAKTSETAAKTSETAAKTSQSAAAGSATTAATKATEASSSAAAALASEGKTSSSANAASASAAAAKSSETAAGASASTASEKAAGASSSAAAAKESETAAKSSATAAKTSETAAKSSETKAKSSETAAAASAATSAAKATEASGSASAALASEGKASSSAAAAKASETNSKASETNSKASETKAAASAAAAKTSETLISNALSGISGSLVDAGELDLSSGEFPPAPLLTSIWTISVSGTVDGDYFAVGDQLFYSASSGKFTHIGNAGGVKTINGLRGDLAIDDVLPAGANGQVLKHNGKQWTAGADSNTTYSGMSQAEAEAGTSTTSRVIAATTLKAAIAKHAPPVTDIAGNAGTATKLKAARTINGVAFDGTNNVTVADNTKLPLSGGTMSGQIVILDPASNSGLEVRTTTTAQPQVKTINTLQSGMLQVSDVGNFGLYSITHSKWLVSSSTTGAVTLNGNALTATKLAASKTIGLSGAATGTATAFDGSGNIAIPVTSLDATKLSGTASISTTGNAATATKLETARTINGAAFDGTKNITVPTPARWAKDASETLNGLREAGFYKVSSANYPVLPANFPLTGSYDGSLTVLGYDAETTQILTNGRNLYFRSNDEAAAGTETGWTEWSRIYTSHYPQQEVEKLAIARQINGVDFDGSKDITVADATKLPLAGGTMTGNLNLSGGAHVYKEYSPVDGTVSPILYGKMGGSDLFRVGIGATATNEGFAEIATADDVSEPIYVRQYKSAFVTLTRSATLLDASGNTEFPGKVGATNGFKSQTGTSYVLSAKDGGAILSPANTPATYTALANYNSTNGTMVLYGHKDHIAIAYLTKAHVDAGTNSTTRIATLIDESGNGTWPGKVTAGTFAGNGASVTSLNMANAASGTLAVARGGTGTTTSTGTGSVVLNSNPTLLSLLINPGTTGNGSIEIGSANRAVTPFIDFHSSGFGNDYDARLVASGGTSGVVGKGTLKAEASDVIASERLTVLSTEAAGGYAATSGALRVSGGISAAGASYIGGPLRVKQYLDLGHGESATVKRAITFYQAAASAGSISSESDLSLNFSSASGVVRVTASNVLTTDDTRAATTTDGLTGSLRSLGGASIKGNTAIGGYTGIRTAPNASISLDVGGNMTANGGRYGSRVLIDLTNGALTAARTSYGSYVRVRNALTYANGKALNFNQTIIGQHVEAQSATSATATHHAFEVYGLRGYAYNNSGPSDATAGATQVPVGLVEAFRGYAASATAGSTTTTLRGAYIYAHTNNATATVTGGMVGVDVYLRNQAGVVSGTHYIYKGAYAGTFTGTKWGISISGSTANQIDGYLKLTSTTAATSTTTGALIVAGGGGFAGKVYASSFEGNASSATKLATARTINGVSFDGTANITIPALSDGGTFGTMYATNWFRSTGATGWYSETYGGGIFMQDTTWVRVYGSKAFHVANQIAATGNITAYYSDARLKTDLRKIEAPLEKIAQLTGYHYHANELGAKHGYDPEKQEVGLLAQDVEKVMPECVEQAPFDLTGVKGESKTGQHYKTLKYERLTPLLIEGVKELADENAKLKERLARLEELIATLV